MRRRLDELRQVRKEAAVIAISVCCGVPGLFCVLLSMLKPSRSQKFRLRDLLDHGKKESVICQRMRIK